MRKIRVYNFENYEMWIADNYEDLSKLFMALNTDDSKYSDPMQSTGLLDVHGNEVFEGDVVGSTWFNGYDDLVGYRRLGGRVVYRKGSFCIEYPGDSKKGYSPTLLDSATGVEIIGNIFEMGVEDED